MSSNATRGSARRPAKPPGDVDVTLLFDDRAEALPAQSTLNLVEVLDWPVLRQRIKEDYQVDIADDDPSRVMAYLLHLVMREHWKMLSQSARGEIAGVLSQYRGMAEQISTTERVALRTELIEMAATIREKLRANVEDIERPLHAQIAEMKGLAESVRAGAALSRAHYILWGGLLFAAVLLGGVAIGLLFYKIIIHV
jgi:hypothetical protein